MFAIYNTAIAIASLFLKLVAFLSPKIRLFVDGRKDTFSVLEAHFSDTDDVLWVHTASLGEFEQGLPLIERLGETYPSHKILVTFFSPSGFEVKKNTPVANLTTYLPLDTKKNARKFIGLVKPKLALFVKYEIWPNYLKVLEQQEVPTLLVSAIFKKEQPYFKWYGGFMRNALRRFSHIFVQDKNSQQLLKAIDLDKVAVSGDTRFDRVSEILDRTNSLDFMERFKGAHFCMVAGSTWPEDEAILTAYINASEQDFKYVLAPHDIKPDHIKRLTMALDKKTLLYSEMDRYDLANFEVLVLDTIGLLTKVYSYADLAYVGGAFATGLHNTLEPAVFGIPVVIGPQYQGFREAEDLVAKKGIHVIRDLGKFSRLMTQFIAHPEFLKKTGEINRSYVAENRGASVQIIGHIRTLL
ncbi:3-deoxy-D-manno-octulosonic acid transferase [Spongiimicrobium sp. 2-473A-2-J]|uniref:3-deoxy-D-manno-octulosonic acid transferase n=1 Tax=Eudoraea algarum TaxID=3417568 RepID=UPI003D36F87A